MPAGGAISNSMRPLKSGAFWTATSPLSKPARPPDAFSVFTTVRPGTNLLRAASRSAMALARPFVAWAARWASAEGAVGALTGGGVGVSLRGDGDGEGVGAAEAFGLGVGTAGGGVGARLSTGTGARVATTGASTARGVRTGAGVAAGGVLCARGVVGSFDRKRHAA